MRFLSPFVLVGLTLIALPVAIHLLVRQRAKRMDFPSLKFLRETATFRLRPSRIQQPLLLALRVSAIAFLVAGLARPLITFGFKTHRTHVIILDASLSMKASGRAEAAKERAQLLINDFKEGERVAIIAVSSVSHLLSSMTSDKRALSEAVDRFQPTNGRVDYDQGLKAADELFQSEPPGEEFIEIISDFQESGLPNLRLVQIENGRVGSAKINTHPVGAKLARNAYLIDEAVVAGESFAEVYGSELVATEDERSGTRKNWTIDSQDGVRLGLSWHTESNGQVTARMTTVTADDFDADDERFLAFTPPRKGRALLIEPNGDDAAPYMQAAFEATATELGEKHFTVDAKPSLPTSSSELESYSLITITLHGAPGTDELNALANYARAGGTVWLCLGNDLDANQWNQIASSETGEAFPFARVERKTDSNKTAGFGSVDSEAPALRFLNDEFLTTLRTVRMHRDYAITSRVGSETFLRWNDATPALVGMKVGNGSVLMMATSPAREDGDLGMSAAFPALASSIAQFGIAARDPLSREIGQSVNLGLAPKTSVRIIDANGKVVETTTSELIAHPSVYFPNPGIYHLESADRAMYLAFNAPDSESELTLAPAAKAEAIFKSTSVPTAATPSAWHNAAERMSNMWRYFFILAFGLFVAELLMTIKQRERTRMGTEI